MRCSTAQALRQRPIGLGLGGLLAGRMRARERVSERGAPPGPLA